MTLEQMLEMLDNFQSPLAHYWLRPEDALAIAEKLKAAEDLVDMVCKHYCPHRNSDLWESIDRYENAGKTEGGG